jgi:glycosyltransferase involved in cell wall biosynthesis
LNYPKVVGLITTYNAADFIVETLSTVSNQNYPNFDIIISDDSSTDGTFEICVEFAQSHPNFVVLKNEKNLGWFANSEKLWKIGASQSDYCFLHPHDDLLYPNFISEQVAVLLANPHAVLAIPGMKNIRSSSNFGMPDSFCEDLSGDLDVIERTLILARRKVPGWWAAYHGLHKSSIVNKTLPISKLQLGDPEFTADLLWLIKVSFYGNFVATGKVLFQKNYTPKTVSASWNKEDKKNKAGLSFGIIQLILNSPLSIIEKIRISRSLVGQMIRGVLNHV